MVIYSRCVLEHTTIRKYISREFAKSRLSNGWKREAPYDRSSYEKNLTPTTGNNNKNHLSNKDRRYCWKQLREAIRLLNGTMILFPPRFGGRFPSSNKTWLYANVWAIFRRYIDLSKGWTDARDFILSSGVMTMTSCKNMTSSKTWYHKRTWRHARTWRHVGIWRHVCVWRHAHTWEYRL